MSTGGVVRTVVQAPETRATLDPALVARYVNGGCLNRTDRLMSLLAPGLPCRRNAARVSSAVRRDTDRVARLEPTAPRVAVEIPGYNGTNTYAQRMRGYLAVHLANDVLGAFVHGSIGTGEEIAYSDFDALIVIRSDVFTDERRLVGVARSLDRARDIMLDFDPLQHHGWFALAEHQLRDYPEAYLPLAALQRARSLYPVEGVTLEVAPTMDRQQLRQTLVSISRSISATLRRRVPGNMYELKSLLSRFMLLPTLYVQVRDGCGVFKGESFELARPDFEPALWSVMDEVSALRARWSLDLSKTRGALLKARHPAARRLARRFAPAVPPHLSARLDADFFARLERLSLAFASISGAGQPCTEARTGY